jgi:predicted house-cleaning noncanonical NTP pyrophosphatase (MazG superfamily)
MRNRKQSSFLLDREEGEDIISRISKVIDKVISEDEAFKEIDKTKLLKELSEMIGEINLHQVSDDELYIRIKKILVLELVFGTLGNLTDKQIETFDEAVERRRVF